MAQTAPANFFANTQVSSACLQDCWKKEFEIAATAAAAAVPRFEPRCTFTPKWTHSHCSYGKRERERERRGGQWPPHLLMLNQLHLQCAIDFAPISDIIECVSAVSAVTKRRPDVSTPQESSQLLMLLLISFITSTSKLPAQFHHQE